MRVVLKLGGAVAAGSAERVSQFLARGDEVVIVHGGGPQIDAELRRRGLDAAFVGGRRVTSAAAMEVVRAVLVRVGADVCRALGPRAIQLVGDEVGLQARRIPGLGRVGLPTPARPPALEDALAAGLLPVVTPVACGPLNVNADEAASALAVGLGAERIVFLTDVRGVLVDGEVAPRLAAEEASRLLEQGVFEGGIVPKLLAAVRAARRGVQAEIGATEVLA